MVSTHDATEAPTKAPTESPNKARMLIMNGWEHKCGQMT
jgi:hypothetical protein